MASFYVTKNNIENEIENISNKINLLLNDKVFDNFIAFTNETYEKQLYLNNKDIKCNIAIDDNGKPYLSSNDDCVFQSHYSTLKDKIEDIVCNEIIKNETKDIIDFKMYMLKRYEIVVNSDNIYNYLKDLKKFDKYLYYKLFTKCSKKLKKEHLSNAEIAYIDYIENLKDDLILLREEKRRYFSEDY